MLQCEVVIFVVMRESKLVSVLRSRSGSFSASRGPVSFRHVSSKANSAAEEVEQRQCDETGRHKTSKIAFVTSGAAFGILLNRGMREVRTPLITISDWVLLLIANPCVFVSLAVSIVTKKQQMRFSPSFAIFAIINLLLLSTTKTHEEDDCIRITAKGSAKSGLVKRPYEHFLNPQTSKCPSHTGWKMHDVSLPSWATLNKLTSEIECVECAPVFGVGAGVVRPVRAQRRERGILRWWMGLSRRRP